MDESLDQLVVRGEHRAVARFVSRKHFPREAQIRLQRQLSVKEEKRVIQSIEDSLRPKVRDQLENVVSQRLDVSVNPLADAVSADVQLQVNVGKATLDFLAEEKVVGVGILIEKLETAVDAVVIRDCDHVHAASLGRSVHGGGRRVAIARPEKRQM